MNRTIYWDTYGNSKECKIFFPLICFSSICIRILPNIWYIKILESNNFWIQYIYQKKVLKGSVLRAWNRYYQIIVITWAFISTFVISIKWNRKIFRTTWPMLLSTHCIFLIYCSLWGPNTILLQYQSILSYRSMFCCCCLASFRRNKYNRKT